MMAFFFTMPISRMMPISAITPRSMRKIGERQNRAHAGRRQRGENRDGMNVALVQHAQHDVHGDDGGQDQPAFVGQRSLEGARRSLERCLDAGRHADLAPRAVESPSPLRPANTPLPRLNEMVTAGNCPWWLMRQRPGRRSRSARWRSVEPARWRREHKCSSANRDRRGTAGSTSSTTWYWFNWVNMIETRRWPKAS